MTAALGYNAYRGRLVLEGTLKLEAPLHIGAGFADPAQQGSEEGEVARIVLGDGGLPVIPPTSLKGAMRALVAKSDAALAKQLFGVIRDDEKGAPGLVTPFAATLKTAVDLKLRTEPMGPNGTYRVTRTAIDGASGVPTSAFLFSKNVVGAGSIFSFRMMVTGDPDTMGDKVRDAFAQLLHTLAQDGLRLGAGKGDGQGHVRLQAGWTLTQKRIANGVLVESDVTADWTRLAKDAPRFTDASATYMLTLTGDGPFMVMGPERPPDNPQSNEPQNKRKALRQNATHPELPGTSLMGALRARARWIVALAKKRGAPVADADILMVELFGADEATLKDDALRQALATRNGVSPGAITGFAGMLKVRAVTPRPSTTRSFHSVKIDRFTQAPMDGALFENEAFVDPVFDVTLHLDSRAKDAHRAFVERLIADMAAAGPRSGLTLGHGASRGCGWFSVQREGG